MEKRRSYDENFYHSQTQKQSQKPKTPTTMATYPTSNSSRLADRLLDENSMHTIRIAYKDYPYPNVKTKIWIRVVYWIR